MVERPTNHLSQEPHQGATGPGVEQEWPEVDIRMLQFLEARCPPRCLDRNEPVEDHLRYAGQSDLVQLMRAAYDKQLEQEGEALITIDTPGYEVPATRRS